MGKLNYSEPDDFFPTSIRKKYKLGEFSEEKQTPKKDKTDKRDLNADFREYVKNGK